MGKEKAGALTPKAIANRIKAKGLQKLRWYCQMCQKQCRDEVRSKQQFPQRFENVNICVTFKELKRSFFFYFIHFLSEWIQMSHNVRISSTPAPVISRRC